MNHRFVGRLSLIRSGILAAVIAGLAATPALADETRSGQAPCSAPQLTQTFLSAGDTNWYTQPGETLHSWSLSGGARVLTTQLADGHTGSILDLPGGSVAVSPVVCVSASYRTARTMVRSLAGDGGLSVYVSYVGTDSWRTPRNIGLVGGSGADWTPSAVLDTDPASRDGWQRARFTLIPGGDSSDFQVYNFSIDPRMT
jgi:hypothetical protein